MWSAIKPVTITPTPMVALTIPMLAVAFSRGKVLRMTPMVSGIRAQSCGVYGDWPWRPEAARS
ncbi:hypothetical protein GCM10029978_070240 [Actinoallomurus acanthiterrae]